MQKIEAAVPLPVSDGTMAWIPGNDNADYWGASNWWNPQEFFNFWSVIRDYHIVGLFTGHQHQRSVTNINDFTWSSYTPTMANPATASPELFPALKDGLGNPVTFDEFRNGAASHCGSDACTGGQVDFYAANVSPQHLDVAKLH